MKQPLKIPRLARREKLLRELGLSPTDATWLTLVCYHSGVFTRRQTPNFTNATGWPLTAWSAA